MQINVLRKKEIINKKEAMQLFDNGIADLTPKNLKLVQDLIGREIDLTVDDIKNFDDKVKDKKDEDTSTEISICQAKKDNGESCTYKAKFPADNPQYCGVHKHLAEEGTSSKKSSGDKVEVEADVLNKLMNKISNLEEQLKSKGNTSTPAGRSGHEEITNRSGDVYGIRFYDVPAMKNHIKHVDVKLSKEKRATDFYGEIIGTNSTFKFSAYVIDLGEGNTNINPDFNSKGVSESTARDIHLVLSKLVAKTKDLLSK